MVKTKRVSNVKTKQAEKQTKQRLKHNKTNWEPFWMFHSMFKGENGRFFLGKNVNRIEDAFLENFSANRRPSACLS